MMKAIVLTCLISIVGCQTRKLVLEPNQDDFNRFAAEKSGSLKVKGENSDVSIKAFGVERKGSYIYWSDQIRDLHRTHIDSIEKLTYWSFEDGSHAFMRSAVISGCFIPIAVANTSNKELRHEGDTRSGQIGQIILWIVLPVSSWMFIAYARVNCDFE